MGGGTALSVSVCKGVQVCIPEPKGVICPPHVGDGGDFHRP